MNDLMQYVLDNKKFYSGIAIIMVLLYHLLCVDESVRFYWLFYPGFIGVDMFLFYSGYSLGFSMKNHTIKDFYVRRIKRIAPLFVLLAIIESIIYYFRDGISLFDFICNITSLSYYQIGGQFIDWYLSFLLILYLLYPVLYKIVRYVNLGGVISLSVAICLFLSFVEMQWYYQVAIARIPIFLLGILIFQVKDQFDVKQMLWFILPLVLSLIMYILHTHVGGCMITDMLAPFMMLGIAFILKRLDMSNFKFIERAGNRSLEIYVANVLVIMIIHSITRDSILLLFTYILLTSVMTILFVSFNQRISKVLN